MDEAAPGHALRLLARRRAAAPDPRSPSQPDGVDGPSEVVDHAAFAWTDAALARRVRCAAPCSTSCTSARSPRTARSTPPSSGSAPRRARRRRRRADAGGRVPGRARLGLRRRRPVRARTTPTAAPTGSSASSTPATRRGLGVVLDVVYNHLGPAGNYLAEFGPYFTDRHRTNWGQAVNFDGAGQRRGAPLRDRQRAACGCATTTSTGSRLDAVHAIVDESARPLPRGARRRGRCPRHAPRPAAVPRRRERPQRPALRPRPRRRRLRPRRRLGRRVAPRAARRAHRRAVGLLRGLRLARACSARRCARPGSTTAPGQPHRQRRHGRPPAGLLGHQFVVCTQNHDQIGNRAGGERSARS